MLVLRGMFSDGVFSYWIEPVHNGSNKVNCHWIEVVVIITELTGRMENLIDLG